MAGRATYLGAVSAAVGQGLLTAIWVASGGLPPARRRAARLGAAAAVAGIGWATSDEDVAHRTPEPGPMASTEPGERDRRRRLAAMAVTAALSTGPLIARRRLEKRWLARLRRHGHGHPHRALAVRMGLLSTALTLPGQLKSAHEAAQEHAGPRNGDC